MRCQCLLYRFAEYHVFMSEKQQPKDRLREARIAAGFDSPADAARAMGVPYPTYAAHENGHRGVSKAAAAKYAERLRVSPGWILYGEHAKISDLPEPVRRLVAHALNSPPEVVNAQLAYFRALEESGRQPLVDDFRVKTKR